MRGLTSPHLALTTRPSHLNNIRIPCAKPNLTATQSRALRQLANDSNITIKPADKGGATVIMDTSLYTQEALRQLHDTKYYRPLQHPVFPAAAAQITSIIGILRAGHYISDRQVAFLTPNLFKASPRRFYLLPKVHKPQPTWPHPSMPAGRPIVSDCGSESYNICKYINYYLRPLTTKHNSYIKDTYHFVQKVKNTPIRPTHLLITGDITSLYTNMHIDKILDAVRKLFHKYPDKNRPDEALLKLLHITLTHNDFVFAGKLFLQILGVAMGRSYAPSTADAYMIEFDEKAQQGGYILDLYSRFLDDIFFLFEGTLHQVKQLEDYLNTLIPDIHITLTANTEICHFLDVYVYKHYDSNGTCTLQTRTYFKPTDTHQLLHTHSYHPKHTFSAILRSQFIRFKRLSSTYEDYKSSSQILTSVLRTRGYSRRLINKTKRDIWHNYNQATTAEAINAANSKHLLPIVTYYDTLQHKINKEWRDEINKNSIISNKYKIIPSYKIHRNLHKILTNSRLDPVADSTATTACNRPRCLCCQHLRTVQQAKLLPHLPAHLHYNQFNCNSSSVVYVISCALCGKRYVGETGQPLKNRLNGHRNDITHARRTTIGLHFSTAPHNITHLHITPIEQTPNNFSCRRRREAFWMAKLKTIHPNGLNHYPL